MQPLRRTTRHLLIGLAAIAVMVASGYAIIMNSDAYRIARQYVVTHPKAVAVLGEGIEARLKWGGRFKINFPDSYRWMRVVLTAKGRKASGTAVVELSRRENTPWVVETAELSPAEGVVVFLVPAR